MVHTVLTKKLSLAWRKSTMLGERATDEKPTVAIDSDTWIETTDFTSPDLLRSFICKTIRFDILCRATDKGSKSCRTPKLFDKGRVIELNAVIEPDCFPFFGFRRGSDQWK